MAKRGNMQKIKRLISILITLTIIASMVVVPVVTQAKSGEDEYVIVDADNASLSLTGSNNKNKVSMNTTTVYEDSGKSIAWYNTGSGGSAKSVDLSSIGLSSPTAFASVTFRMYSDAADSINLLVYYTNTSGATGKYVREPYTFSSEAGNVGKWVEVTLDLTDIDGSKHTNLTKAASKLESIQLNRGGWSTSSTYNNNVYIDKIWFSKMPIPDTIGIADTEKLLENTDAFIANTENKRLYSSTAEWNGEEFDVTFDASKYNLADQEYLYQWIYSPEATGEEISIRLVNSTNSTFVENTFCVDWTGWKLVELYTCDFYGSGNLNGANIYRITSANSELCFDKIWFSNKQHATVVASDLFSRAGMLPVKNAEFRIELSTGISVSAEDAIEINKGGSNFTDFEAEKNGNIITVKIPSLEKGAQYSVSLKEGLKSSQGIEFSDIVPISFSAYETGSTAENITFIEENGTVSAKTTVSLKSGDEATFVIAGYDNGSISAIDSINGTGEKTTPAITVSANTKVKSWILSEKYGVLQQASLSTDNSNMLYQPTQNVTKSFALNSMYQDDNGFVLDMSYQGTGRQAVVIVTDSDGNAVIAEEFIIDSDLQYVVDADSITLAPGAYKAIVALVGDNKAYSADTFYINAAEEAQILYDVNHANQYTDVLALMNSYKELFRVKGISDKNTLAHIANVIFEQKSYESFGEIHDVVDLAQSVLNKLNSSDWSKLGDLFDTYSIILNDSEAYDKYNQLNTEERIAVCRELVLDAPYNNFSSLRSIIVELVKDYQENGTIGSVEKPSVSGNASGKDKEVWAQNPGESKEGFVDLNKHSWAVESIYELLKRNVITMPQDHRYRPGDLVTKAEFIKLLVQAIGLDITEKENCFSDVKESDWYSPYITAAKKAGIIYGDNDNNIKPNEPIKRQDMAVMVKRAIDAIGIEFKIAEENCRIADFSEIDTYARDAVKKVMEYGIMRGVGNDNYAPKESTNRASAAVVILKLMNGIRSGGVIDIEEVESVAADISQMQEYRLLNAIGVIADNDSILQSSAVTRREVARTVSNIIVAGDEVYTKNDETSFEDVKEDDDDLGAITMMVSSGYMTSDDGFFRPDDAITMYELSKVVISLLGYNFVADHEGGYPIGYMNAMSSLKLTKGIYLDESSDISNEEFINLIYNVLMSSPAKLSGISNKSFIGYTVNSDNTLLYQNYGIYELTGLFEADMFSDILMTRPRPAKGSVIISGENYNSDFEDINNLVGHMVKAYIIEDEGKVVFMFSYQTEELTFPGNDLSIDDSKIYYRTDDEKKLKSEEYSKNVSLLYNGRQTAFDASLFENINGTVTIIDNDRDGAIDVIKINNYKTIQVNNTSTDLGIITDGLSGGSIVLNNLEMGEEYLIYKNGKKATLKDIKLDDVISYTEVQSPKLITIYACDNTIKGTAKSIRDDEIVINNETYYITPLAKNRIQLGTETKFYLDIFGTIVGASTSQDMVYGYLYKIYEDPMKMNIFTENNRWVKLELAEKVKLNNKKVDAIDVLEFFGDNPSAYKQLIRYNVNDEAQIIKIYTAEQYTPWSQEESNAISKDRFRLFRRELNSQYYNTNKCFGTYMPVSDNTKIFLVPPKTENADKDDFHIISPSALVSNRKYADVASYNADETFVADVVVMHDTMDNVYAVTNDSNVAPLMVVTDINTALNQMDEACYMIVGAYNGSAKISFNTRDLTLKGINDLERGDIVQLGIDREGYVIKFEKKFSAEQGFKQYIPASSVYAKDAFMGGKIMSINPQTKRFVIQCDTSDIGIAASFGSNLKIYIYDIDNNEVKLATTNDIHVGDMVFVGSRYLTAQQIVIFR